MSCFDVQILDPNINTIEIETCIGDQPASIDILTYDNTSVIEVNHCIALLPSEINDLIPVLDILSGSGISVGDSSGIYTISLSSDPITNSSDIVDLLEAVQDIIGNSGLVSGNYININYDDNTGYTTVSATGLQPSGNYSVNGHTHTSSNITDFNSSVSGLLPVKNIIAGSGIGISSNSGDFTVSVTGTFGLTSEQVDDRVSNLLVGGNYVNLNYNDLGNSLTISVTGVQPSGNYSLVGHSHNTSDITNFNSGVSGLLPSVSGSGYIVSSFTNNMYTIIASGLQPSGNYAASSHVHTSSDVTDFNSSVSGLLPVKNVTGSGYVGVSSVSGVYSVSVSGLQPSGNYSVVGHSHVIADVSGLQNALDSKQPSGVYASGIHSHVSNDITDFNSSVSGLLPSVTGVGQAVSSFSNNLYTISVTGLQPSGNYSVVGHTHLSSDITDFDSAVSGLIPPSNFTSLSGISGVVVTNSGTNYFVALSDPTIQLADITDLSSNARTFLLTPSSNNLSTLISDETGSGNLVFNTSPAFSGTPTVPTAPSGTNSTQIASTAFVRTEISNLVDSSPSTLDTLNELAAALGDDPNFATTIASGLGQKANLSGAIFTGPVTIPSGTGNFNNLSVNNIAVSISGHIHSYTDITNFASGIEAEVSTLLVAGNYVNINYDNLANTITISATGLQPSGNYANSVHNHGNITNSGAIGSISGLLVMTDAGGLLTTSSGITSSYITNFNSSVSGLIPIKELVGVSGILVSSSGETKQISSNFIPGNGIAFNYNNDESLTISTITNNGLISISDNSTTALTIPSGYSVGSLSLYQNGVKLLENIDYTASNGSGVMLTSPPTSGSYIEYSTPVINNNIQSLIDNSISSVYDTQIYSLGNASGTVSIDYSTDRMIQTFNMNSNPITLTKGTGWPTSSISRDVVLQMTCINPASITWSIVGSNWYNQPEVSLPSGEYMVLLRAMGSGVIQGHYIGQKQGSL